MLHLPDQFFQNLWPIVTSIPVPIKVTIINGDCFFFCSYTRLSDDVDHVFPPLKPRLKVNGHPTPIFSSPEEFSYFTYWRDPVLSLAEDDMLMWIEGEWHTASEKSFHYLESQGK